MKCSNLTLFLIGQWLKEGQHEWGTKDYTPGRGKIVPRNVM